MKRRDIDLVTRVIKQSENLTEAEKFCLAEDFINAFLENGGSFDAGKFRLACGTVAK